jgi:hypothetical protein
MPMMRRGPGLVGTAAKTAVVVGTAGRVAHRQQQKYAAQDTAAAPPPPEAAAAAPTEAAEPEYMDELRQLAQLRDAGIITPEEFEAKKAQVLGI